MVTLWWDASGRLSSHIHTHTHTHNHVICCAGTSIVASNKFVCVCASHLRHLTTVCHVGSSVPTGGHLSQNGKGASLFSCSMQLPHWRFWFSLLPLLWRRVCDPLPCVDRRELVTVLGHLSISCVWLQVPRIWLSP